MTTRPLSELKAKLQAQRIEVLVRLNENNGYDIRDEHRRAVFSVKGGGECTRVIKVPTQKRRGWHGYCMTATCTRKVCPDCGHVDQAATDAHKAIDGLTRYRCWEHKDACAAPAGGVKRLNAPALAKLWRAQERQVQIAQLMVQAHQKKIVALATYKSACIGCGNRNPDQVFLALFDDLEDPTCHVLARGRTYVLASRWHVATYDRIHASGSTLDYRVFCWDCFKRMGRKRRKALGIRHPLHPWMQTRRRYEEAQLVKSLGQHAPSPDDVEAH
jgi:hypothetical protein